MAAHAALGLAHAACNRVELAFVEAEERQDRVSLPDVPAAEDDALVE